MTAARVRLAPIPGSWDGDPAQVAAAAGEQLRLLPTDTDMVRVQELAAAVVSLVQRYLGVLQPFTVTGAVPDPVYQACVSATVDAYRRKDMQFGISSAFDGDGTAMRISSDWLAGVKPQLQLYREQFGLA